jgi:hypothetical protein
LPGANGKITDGALKQIQPDLEDEMKKCDCKLCQEERTEKIRQTIAITLILGGYAKEAVQYWKKSKTNV